MITDTGLLDLAEADDMFSMPSSGTLTYDLATGRAIAVEDDPTVTTRQQNQIRTMLTTARSLRRITHPELLDLQPLEAAANPYGPSPSTPPNTTTSRSG